MGSTSKIEIKISALENNFSFITSLIGSNTKLSVVIKGNAYGHGTHTVIPILENLGVTHFSVYSSAEAKVAYYERIKDSDIMIMGYISKNDYDWVVKNKVEFYISSLEDLKLAIESSKNVNKKAQIHIDLETGMNRTGLSISQLRRAIPIILENIECLEIKGITTHLAGAESIANHMRIRKQFAVYKKRLKLLENNNITGELKHVASSAATINYPEMRLDMVRIGILIYGYWPTRETFIQYIHRRKDKSDPIKRALRWTSEIIITKIIPSGEFIGYGMSYQAQHKMQIAIIPVGYCNGYSRSLSNTGHLLIKDQKAPVIGSVNMNMIICDVTHIQKIKIGDPVILIGKQGENEITFSSFAEMNNSMNYEILARLPENIKRSIIT
ncbi:MAG: alanine racemase [Salinivirgaceae bacterium]|nr:alanine racemase [Salinivirgaceae bacterium]